MYDILLKLVYLILHLIPSKKYKKWRLAQKQLFKTFKPNKKKVIWIHCASLGEYEHIKALIPELQKINPLINITFFSPSGYDYFYDIHLIKQKSYLPLDTKENIKSFIKIMNPMMVIISKNDIWPNMVTYLQAYNIPSYSVGSKLNSKKIKNWFVKKYYKKYFSKISHIFCEDQFTYQFIKNEKISDCSIIGNTRINQILLDKEYQFNNDKILNFINQKTTIIYGSVEDNDYEKIIDFIHSKKDVKHIIVPHEINPSIIKKIERRILSNYILYSTIEENINTKKNILIVDKFGILKHLYKYSTIAYVGGGFNQGIHNTLEAVIHGNFVLFGPKYKKFEEAYWLIDKQIGKSISNHIELREEINSFLKNPQSKENIAKKILSFLTTKQQNLDSVIEIIKNKK
jgi:3-deoxy-D-manno-octulosonic-acid transferase